MNLNLSFLFVLLSVYVSTAQVDQSQTGVWFMYFFNTQFKNSQFGLQGDLQYRNWDSIGDLEQFLVRTGVTYTPKDANILFTLGVANITTGAFGDSNATTGKLEFIKKLYFLKK